MDKCNELTDCKCDSDIEEEVGNKAHVLNKKIGDCQQEKENIQDNIKSDSGNSVKFIKFFNEIQSIIKEDECRRNGWEKSEKTSSFPIVNYTEEMSIDEIECSLDKLKQNIINKLNKYFEQLRETDAKLMKMEKEYRNLQETIKLKSENPKKTNYSKESKDNYKSLNLVVNKKSQIQIDQLNDEIKTLETENEECRSKMKTLKKEIRQNKTQIEDLTDDLKETEEKNKKLQSEIRNLKKQKKDDKKSDDEDGISDLKEQIKKLKSEYKHKDNKKSENEDEVSDLKEQIIKLKSENKQKDEAGKQREKEMNKMKQSLQEKDENCKMLENEKQDILDEKNTLQKKIDEEKIHGEELMKLNEIVEKKNQAIEKIKGKYDNELYLRKDFEEKNKTLKNQCEKLEDEKKIFLDEKKNHEEEQIKLKELVEKKHEALSVLRDKLVYYKAQENEFEKLRLTTQQLNSKEKEVERLTNELNKLNEALDDKSKECEILRKEKLSCEEEIKNMKQLKFQSKANTESK